MNGSSVFKGEIATGTVGAEFLSDASNDDPDILTIQYQSLVGDSRQVDRAVVSPGGQARVAVDAVEDGVLEVWVVTGTETDGGRLRVTEGGETRDDDAVRGPVRWVYSVESRLG